MTVAEILRAAATRIQEKGWIQGAYHDDNGRSCVAGALGLACDAAAVFGAEGRRIFDILRATIGGGNIPQWNDALGRTKEEVVAALIAAAEKAERQ